MKTFMLIAMLVVLPMQAQADIAFFTGNRLVTDMRESEKYDADQPGTSRYSAGLYTGYVIAATEAYSSAGLICTSTNVTVGQVSAVVTAYLKANPTFWHHSALSLVELALKEAFPCE